ncbi:MAG: peptidoglycan bridge formation glycyltransferase FemA/FemB family protein [Patescibacteria group bacterium]
MQFEIAPIKQKEVWETFVATHAPQALFQSWLWGEVQERLEHKIWRLGLFEDSKLVGIAQIVKIIAKRGTFLHIRHGPIFVSHTKTHWESILDYVKKLARQEHAWFIRVSPLIANSEEHTTLFSHLHFRPAAIHEVDGERCWVLDLDKSEEELLMGMRKTTRYEIKLAQKLNVSVRKSSNPADLSLFFRLYKETSKRHGFVTHQGIAEEFEVFADQQKALLLLATHEGKVLAGAIVLFYGNQAIYHHGASITSKIPASYIIQWEAIREAKKRGIKVYNFYGVAPENKPNHPWRGITLFKKGFGGREIEYIHAHDLAVSPLYVIPRTIEIIRRLSRGY